MRNLRIPQVFTLIQYFFIEVIKLHNYNVFNKYKLNFIVLY